MVMQKEEEGWCEEGVEGDAEIVELMTVKWWVENVSCIAGDWVVSDEIKQDE